MESIGKTLQSGWAGILYPHPFEKQEYILTPEEEQNALEYALQKEQQRLRFNLQALGATEDEIKNHHSAGDFVNRDRILEQANSNKHHAEWEKQCRVLEKKQAQETKELLKKEWTASALFLYLKNVVESRFQSELLVNQQTLPLIRLLCFFISEDERFETELNLDLKKGLLLRGRSGLGKTFIPICLSENGLRPISLFNIIEITDKVKEVGFFETPKKDGILYIDDVGTEESPILRYGTPINWFKEFIEKYHYHKLSFNKLILSTNLESEKIESKYGYRVRSRIREMFNVVDLTGDDLR